MSHQSFLRARGALVLIELEDGAFIAAELPHPHVVTLSVRFEFRTDIFEFTRARREERYMSVEIEEAFEGRYTYISAEGVAEWFARRQREGWGEEPPALPPATPELEP